MVLEAIELEALGHSFPFQADQRPAVGSVRPMCEHTFVSQPVPPIPLVKREGRPPATNRTCAVEMRTCHSHGVVEFALYSRGGGRRRWRCKRCIGEAVTRRKQRVRKILVAEGGGCCAVCGYDRCIVSLVFHHVEPAEKSFALHMGTGKALATYREEARKCVLVCANCHGEIETGQIPSPPPGAKYTGRVA